MGKRDKRIDTYIAKSAPFARPILEHLRELVHTGCPQAEETMKWSFPHFDYKGMLCSMAAFKQHAIFGFWKASLMKNKRLMLNAKSETSMGHLGKITSLKDLPSDKVMIGYIKEAVSLNDEGLKIDKAKPILKPVATPDYFRKALKGNMAAQETFEAFSPSNKREYVEWVTEAKTEATRIRRLETAVEWMADGKVRNWKYVTR